VEPLLLSSLVVAIIVVVPVGSVVVSVSPLVVVGPDVDIVVVDVGPVSVVEVVEIVGSVVGSEGSVSVALAPEGLSGEKHAVRHKHENRRRIEEIVTTFARHTSSTRDDQRSVAGSGARSRPLIISSDNTVHERW
jgi:hypothetical protein